MSSIADYMVVMKLNCVKNIEVLVKISYISTLFYFVIKNLPNKLNY